MPVLSAGLLLHRGAGAHREVLLAHPGGPFWAHRDDGAWTVPKGEYGPGEDPWAAAQREFTEEVGLAPPAGRRIDLGEFRQPSGKRLRVFAVAADLDISAAHSNTFTLEWPPRSGRRRAFPEIDRVGWFPLPQARVKLLRGQLPVLECLLRRCGGDGDGASGGQ